MDFINVVKGKIKNIYHSETLRKNYFYIVI